MGVSFVDEIQGSWVEDAICLSTQGRLNFSGNYMRTTIDGPVEDLISKADILNLTYGGVFQVAVDDLFCEH